MLGGTCPLPPATELPLAGHLDHQQESTPTTTPHTRLAETVGVQALRPEVAAVTRAAGGLSRLGPQFTLPPGQTDRQAGRELSSAPRPAAVRRQYKSSRTRGRRGGSGGGAGDSSCGNATEPGALGSGWHLACTDRGGTPRRWLLFFWRTTECSSQHFEPLGLSRAAASQTGWLLAVGRLLLQRRWRRRQRQGRTL